MQTPCQHSQIEIVNLIYKDILPLRPREGELIVCQHKLLPSKTKTREPSLQSAVSLRCRIWCCSIGFDWSADFLESRSNLFDLLQLNLIALIQNVDSYC